jgi:nucleoside-diphosphate-sugar epimerase
MRPCAPFGAPRNSGSLQPADDGYRLAANAASPRVTNFVDHDLRAPMATNAVTSFLRQPVALATGAAGFLGGHFVYWWRRSRGPIAAVVRADDEESALQRVRTRQDLVATAYPDDPQAELADVDAFAGDVARPLCGLSQNRIDALRRRGVDSFWHFAASLRFEQGHRADLFRDNIEGTANALALAAAIGARRFVYISTAYSCGARDDAISEELHPVDGPFNNAYEESKCRAEHLVIERSTALGLSGVVLRPSVVVGPSKTWRPGGSDFGLYGLLRHASILRKALAGRTIAITVRGDPVARLHLIPVDHLMRDCLDLEASDFPGGPIYHVTSDGGPMVSEVAAIICDALGLPGARIGALPANPSSVERWFDRCVDFYTPYLNFRGSFIRSLPRPTTLGIDDLRRLVSEYLATRVEEAA